MAKKVENKDIIANNLLEPLIGNLSDALKGVNALTESLKELLKTSAEIAKTTPLDSLKNIQKKEGALNNVKKASTELKEVEEKRGKILKALADIQSNEAKQNAVLEEQLRRKKKELKEVAEIEADRIKGIKRLSTAEKEAAKEAEKLAKEAEKLAKEGLKREKELAKEIEKTQKLAANEKIKKRKEADKEVAKLLKKQLADEKAVAKELKRLQDKKASDSEKAAKKTIQENKKLEKESERAVKSQIKEAEKVAFLSREYIKQSRSLNENRNAYKDLFLETEKNRKGLKGLIFRFTSAGKELRKLGKDVNNADKKLKDLDKSVGQSQRKVGDYIKQVGKLSISFTKLAAASLALKAIDKGLEGIKNAFDSNSTSAAIFDKAVGAIGATVGVFVNTLVNSIPAILGLFSSLADGFSIALLELKLFKEEAKDLFGGGDKEAIKTITKEIEDLKESLADNKGFSEIAENFDGFIDKVKDAVEASNQLVDATQASRLRVIALTNALSLEADAIASLSDSVKDITKDNESLLEAETRLDEQSGSNVISLQRRAKATKELLVIRAAISDQSVKIAQEERNLAALRLKLSEKGITDGSKNIAAREALAEANKKLAEATTEATKDRVSAERELLDIETDIIERNLDFIIDTNEKRIEVNNDLIQDETVSFAKRKALFNENQRLRAMTFKDQQEEINQGIKDVSKRLDFNELLLISDAKVLSERVQSAGINDKLAARAIEILINRTKENRDAEKSERDLTRARQEGREVEEDIELQLATLEIIRTNRGELVSALEKLEKQRTQNQIDNLKVRLDLIAQEREARKAEILEQLIANSDLSDAERERLNKELENIKGASAEELKLKQELLDKILEQEQTAGEKLIEQRVKLQETLSGLTNSFFDARFKRQNEQLDKQLAAEKARTEELRELAKNNVEGATENLIFQQKREAEIERERERLRKRQAKQKVFLTLLDTASAKAAAGDENAIINTIFDAEVLKKVAGSLANFYDGTDLTGRGNVDNKGGFLSVLHPNETVLSEADRSEMGSPTSRKEIITGYNLGKMVLDQGRPPTATQVVINQDDRVVSKLESVEKAIRNKPVLTHIDYDTITNLVTDRIEQGNKIINNHRTGVRKH